MNNKIRVCLFGSYYTGYEVLSSLLELSKRLPIELVGVVSDNPYEAFSNPKKRFWQYGHSEAEANMVIDLAQQANIPTWNGRVKNLIKDKKIIHKSNFPDVLKNNWAPDVIYMAAFGQRITQDLIDIPKFGFFNIHTSSVTSLSDWPKFDGADGFEKVLDAKISNVNVVLHEVVEKIDAGPAVCFSPPVSLFIDKEHPTPPVLQVMRSCSKPAGMLVSSHLLASIWPKYKNLQSREIAEHLNSSDLAV